jgi:hypothetical protein
MRTLLLACFFYTIFITIQAQPYYVVRVNETVHVNNAELHPKDKVVLGGTVRFSSSDAYAYVVSPENGYYYIAVKKGAKPKKGELNRALRDALIPPSEYSNAATRATKPYESVQFKDQYDLKTYFQGPLFFIDPARFNVAATTFPLDSNHYFALKHYTGKDSFVNILPQDGQTFILSADAMERDGETPVITSSTLFYVDKKSGKEKALGNFKLTFLSPEATTTMLEELKTIYISRKQEPLDSFVKNHALPYLALFYGKTQEAAIIKLLAGYLSE